MEKETKSKKTTRSAAGGSQFTPLEVKQEELKDKIVAQLGVPEALKEKPIEIVQPCIEDIKAIEKETGKVEDKKTYVIGTTASVCVADPIVHSEDASLNDNKLKIHFSHDYDKLKGNIFTTLRELTWSKYSYYARNINKTFDVCVVGSPIIRKAVLMLAIEYLPINSHKEFLKYDTEGKWDIRVNKKHILLLFKNV